MRLTSLALALVLLLGTSVSPVAYTPDNSNRARRGSHRTKPMNTNSASHPAGATARCNDGTYSYSQHRQGTCSHHGGVAEWY